MTTAILRIFTPTDVIQVISWYGDTVHERDHAASTTLVVGDVVRDSDGTVWKITEIIRERGCGPRAAGVEVSDR